MPLLLSPVPLKLGSRADRFHILKNLGEALEGLLARHLATKRQKKIQETLEEHIPIEHATRSVRLSSKVKHLQQARREERLASYEEVVALHTLGMSQAAIAERVGLGHSTVSRWLAAGTFPETTRGPYVSRLDPYLPYLFHRWESGCHNMAGLFRELVDRGYKGSYESVRDHLVRQLPEGKKNAARGAMLSPAPLPSRQATFLFLRRPEKLTPEEQADLLTLRQTHPEVNQTYDLVQQFAQMLRTRTGEQLGAWLAKVADSQIPELQSFTLGIERDKPAVTAGLTLPHSNGIVEGKVNKLKLLKRMGYGRAGFPRLASTGVACALESEVRYDSLIEELHKILMRVCQLSSEPLSAKNDPEGRESHHLLHQSRGRPQKRRNFLRTYSTTKIQRHIKVKGTASPYDGNLLYWSQRLKTHPMMHETKVKLLQKQAGKCRWCELQFHDGDLIEIDHLTPKSEGGREELHRHCHDARHAKSVKAEMLSKFAEAGIHHT